MFCTMCLHKIEGVVYSSNGNFYDENCYYFLMEDRSKKTYEELKELNKKVYPSNLKSEHYWDLKRKKRGEEL